MKEALLRGRLTEFGELMGTAWEAKKRQSPRITTPTIDAAYEEAVKQGAIGGKVTGAGGGGFMLFYCRPGCHHRVAERLHALGLEPAEFAFDHEGLRTWTYVES
jgi:D-glycero-alpha-D-manno-heptose-7-phosphate kinase